MPYFGQVLLIAECTTQMIADRLPSYRGQPVSAIIDKLGIPSDERVIAGRKAYIWANSNFVEGTNYKCQIRAVIDDQNTIVSTDFEGNQGGCAGFAAKLNR